MSLLPAAICWGEISQLRRALKHASELVSQQAGGPGMFQADGQKMNAQSSDTHLELRMADKRFPLVKSNDPANNQNTHFDLLVLPAQVFRLNTASFYVIAKETS
jgi:hypothetical protein